MIASIFGPPWEPRIPPRFVPDRPESLVLVDELAALLERDLAGVRSTREHRDRLLRSLCRAAFADRKNKRTYSARSDGVGENERLQATLFGALAYAAVLVELRKAHLRD